MSEAGEPADRQRIDRWLWHARIVRTRADAAALARAGHVRVNGTRVTAAAHPVRLGDVLTVALDGGVRLVAVTGFAERRGPAAAARLLFEDRTAPPLGTPTLPANPRPDGGRPTGRARRQLDRLRRDDLG